MVRECAHCCSQAAAWLAGLDLSTASVMKLPQLQMLAAVAGQTALEQAILPEERLAGQAATSRGGTPADAGRAGLMAAWKLV